MFSRVNISGKSNKAYTIRHSAVHGWNFDKLRDIGAFTQEHVEYDVLNVDRVPWQDTNSDYPEFIVQKPSHTVASIYRQQRSESESEFFIDPVRRSKTPNADASGLQSGMLSGTITRSGATARGTPVNNSIAAFKPPEQDSKSLKQDRKIRGLQARGFTSNLMKLLTSSKPPHRPTGSWVYKDFPDEKFETVRTSRDFPRFNPTRFLHFHDDRPSSTLDPLSYDLHKQQSTDNAVGSSSKLSLSLNLSHSREMADSLHSNRHLLLSALSVLALHAKPASITFAI